MASSQVTIPLDSTVLHSRVISQDLINPWDLVWGNDNNIWFTTKNGYIMRVNPVTTQTDTIHYISEIFISSLENSGLHALGLHPKFPDSAYIYTHYTYDTLSAKLVRWTYDPIGDTVTDSMQIIPYMPGARSHNGSRLQWDTDSTFLLSTGDAYLFGAAQDTNSYVGKILRFKDDGSIPDDNPWGNSPNYAIGFRNPQGLIILPNGDVFSSEHGTTEDDELNRILPGRNYGWPNVLGACDSVNELAFCSANNVMEPIYTWTPTWAVCGLDYYDHPQIPELKGSLLLATLKAQRLLRLKLDFNNYTVDTAYEVVADTFGRLRDILVAPNGNLYISTSNHSNYGSHLYPNDDKIIELSNPNFTQINKIIKTHTYSIYPNPTNGDINFIIKGGLLPDRIEIIDISGRVCKDVLYNETINLNILQGTYFVRLVANGIYFEVKKIIVN
jgi:glucose/arabinose dehydrogenase